MTSLREVSTTEFRESLTPAVIRVSQVIYFALAAGASMFALIVIYLYFQQSGEGATPDYSLLNTLTMAHAVFAILMWTVSKSLFEKQFSEENLGRVMQETFADKEGHQIVQAPAQQCMSVIRTASIMRLAVLEVPAFFGLVVSVVAVTGGAAQNKPVYLMNMASAALFAAYVVATFPNAERLEAIFEKYFHR